ncbi:serine/threonine-protein kinase RsbW [Nakamurella panacisegetis]|uniref:Serine/threonine-protein kinase RsbW n=1 Tax=Nakamurella panacisegetis TaxID=1090615 RepID=A0A1H0IRD0_9ACTN|nr:ATP-binding protein [Nakamurella panacisegetis]SDO33986.1 serine/threonine-protein kinase RsbW [Nakamurella panacisegetis]
MTDAVVIEHSLHACVDPDCLGKVHALVEQLWAESVDVAEIDRILFESAVLEIAGNIVQHSVSDQPILCNLTLRIYPTRLEAVFCDTAEEAAVDVESATMPDDLAESGRGLAMTKRALDQLSYQREGHVNCWRLSRTRTG